MTWKSILPPGLKVNDLTFEECRNFSQYYKALTRKFKGPISAQIFYRLNLHLATFGICCVMENRFPPVTRAHEVLAEHFINEDFDEQMLMNWLFCDFPVERDGDKMVIDYFHDFMADIPRTDGEQQHVDAFCKRLKKSRLGLYEEIQSTKKATRFKELFTGKVINTVRSVPDYEKGELFVGRIVGHLGDKFLIHDPRCFPPEHKEIVREMYAAKFHYIQETFDDAKDYDQFMRLAGPYTMSVTCGDPNVPIFSPDVYEEFYQ